VAELSFDLLLVLAAAFAAGLIDAMVGGGGLIQIPALFAVYPNVAPATLLGTSKFSGLLGMVSAVARYARKVHIPWRALLPMALVALVMSVGGAWLARVVAPEIFRPLVPVMLLAVLIYVMWRKGPGRRARAARLLRLASHRRRRLDRGDRLLRRLLRAGRGQLADLRLRTLLRL
jgi:uncharacterized membrane protein YfcA